MVWSQEVARASILLDGLFAQAILRSKTTRLTGSMFRASILLDGLVAPGSSPSRSISAFTLCNLELGDLIADGTRTVARVGPLAGALSP